MRILDLDSNTALNRVILYLTSAEAEELRDSVETLLMNKGHHHEHVSSVDFQKEVTITIYDFQRIESFDERSRQLIEDDA